MHNPSYSPPSPNYIASPMYWLFTHFWHTDPGADPEEGFVGLQHPLPPPSPPPPTSFCKRVSQCCATTLQSKGHVH